MEERDNFTRVYNYLQLGGKHSTKELSEIFGVTVRTIQILIKEMRENTGLEKEGTLYFFPDEFRNIDIHKKVQMSTALMISLYKCALPELQESILYNFNNLPQETDAFLFDINFEHIENEQYFSQVVDAILNKLAVAFEYTNSKNVPSSKSVYPIKMTNLQGYWYLMGYDLEYSKIKSFSFNNIQNLTTLDDSFIYEKQIKELKEKSLQMTSPWFSNDEKFIELKVTGDAILYIKRQKNTMLKIINNQNTKELIVEMKYYNDIEVLTFIKRWLPFIEILNNDDLKQKLKTTLQTYLQN